ncbi:unnamed protein product [Caretta caretta]
MKRPQAAHSTQSFSTPECICISQSVPESAPALEMGHPDTLSELSLITSQKNSRTEPGLVTLFSCDRKLKSYERGSREGGRSCAVDAAEDRYQHSQCIYMTGDVESKVENFY